MGVDARVSRGLLMLRGAYDMLHVVSASPIAAVACDPASTIPWDTSIVLWFQHNYYCSEAQNIMGHMGIPTRRFYYSEKTRYQAFLVYLKPGRKTFKKKSFFFTL